MPHHPPTISRRSLLATTALVGLASQWPLHGAALGSVTTGFARPLPLDQVRLLPSLYLDAVEANRRYLMALEPDRLLHNFRKLAGL